MTWRELLFIVIALAFIALLIWHNAAPYVSPQLALAEEPCIRTTRETYDRNYPPDGTTLTRRPTEWQTCTPWVILEAN